MSLESINQSIKELSKNKCFYAFCVREERERDPKSIGAAPQKRKRLAQNKEVSSTHHPANQKKGPDGNKSKVSFDFWPKSAQELENLTKSINRHWSRCILLKIPC